jgi:anti-sigma regulatory factor (Ser/Thr protein kinase)
MSIGTVTATAALPEPRSYRLTAPNVIDTPRLARNHVADVLRHTGHPLLVDDARLLVSETVSNVFQHTHVPRLVVHTTIWPDRAVVAVQDAAARWVPERRMPGVGALAECGRGLALLAALADKWGVDRVGAPPEPEAKSVWFELLEEG